MLAPCLTKWRTNRGKVVYPTNAKPTGTCRLVAKQMHCDSNRNSHKSDGAKWNEIPAQQESSRETGRSRLSVSAPRSVATILWAILFLAAFATASLAGTRLFTPSDAQLAEDVLHAHRRYLGYAPPDALLAPEELAELDRQAEATSAEG